MRVRLALLIVALAAGCSTRDRSNPFDPANQVTSGRPAGFVALAGNLRVDLRWDATSASGLRGYQLFRRVAGSGEFTALTGLLQPYTVGYADLGLANGVDYEYRLYFVFSHGLGGAASEVATPGTVRPWVVDYTGGSLNAVTPDGRQVATRVGGFRGPSAVAVDTSRGLVWVSEYDGGMVRVYNPATRVSVTIPGLRPGAIAVQPTDGTAWVCDESSGRVFHFRANGQPAGVAIDNVDDPIGVAADAGDLSVWVCEWLGNRVRHHEEGGPLRGSAVINKPSRVAIDAATGAAWVTSFTSHAVYRLTPSGPNDGSIELSLTQFGGPIGIAVDEIRRRVWVADARDGRVFALDPDDDGSVEFDVAVLGASDVAVDPRTGDAWVATRDAREVVRISPTGTLLRRMTRLVTPFAVGVDHLADPGP